jgi:hypothetical protein
MEKTRKIQLQDGEVLEVSMNPGFLERVSSYFELSKTEKVTDDHIRMYIFDVFKNAIDKAENEGFRENSA